MRRLRRFRLRWPSATPLFVLAALACLPAPAFSQAQAPDEAVFRRLDRDGDGKLSREELPAALRANFDRVDANHDGAISLEEHAAFRRRAAATEKSAPNAMKIPEAVMAVPDVSYANNDNARQQLDLMVPKQKSAQPLPVVVYIHGGAWLGGDRRGGWPFLIPYVSSGKFVGVSVGYRLSREATWPAQIHDCKAAIRWIRANAKKYDLDPDRIGLVGPSAGGHLVAMLGVSAGVPGLEGDIGPYAGLSTRVTCVVDEYGPADLQTIHIPPSRITHDAPDSPESRLLGGPLLDRPDAARSASPVNFASAEDPPFLIIHGDKDDTVPFNQSERMAEALQKAGVGHAFITVKGGGHGNFRNPEVSRRIRQFLENHLLGQNAPISEEPIAAGAESAP